MCTHVQRLFLDSLVNQDSSRHKYILTSTSHERVYHWLVKLRMCLEVVSEAGSFHLVKWDGYDKQSMELGTLIDYGGGVGDEQRHRKEIEAKIEISLDITCKNITYRPINVVFARPLPKRGFEL